MAKTFKELVADAQAHVSGVTPEDLHTLMEKNRSILVIDVRDAADIASFGIIPKAEAISLGTLPYKADPTMPKMMRHPDLGNFTRPIVTTCFVGAVGILAARLLQVMGYTNVRYLKSGTMGWQEAGFEVQQFSAN